MSYVSDASNVEVKTKRQNLSLIFGNDHSKLRILLYSRLENQRTWPLVVTATMSLMCPICFLYRPPFYRHCHGSNASNISSVSPVSIMSYLSHVSSVSSAHFRHCHGSVPRGVRGRFLAGRRPRSDSRRRRQHQNTQNRILRACLTRMTPPTIFETYQLSWNVVQCPEISLNVAKCHQI